MKKVLSWTFYVLIASAVPFTCWMATRCDCKDALVVGHTVQGSHGGSANLALIVRGKDEYNGTPCERIVGIGLQTYLKVVIGDSIHFEKDPI